MANRREFLQGTIAASALPLVSGATLAPFAANATPLARVLYDERLPVSRSFAERARQAGLPTHAFNRDITPLWFDDLHQRWTKKPEAIAGITEGDALFCLERLAWDYKMRVTFLAQHHTQAGGGVGHTISTPGKLSASDLDAAGARWADVIASELMTPHAAQTPMPGATPIAMTRNERELKRPLVSWVIAPVRRAVV